MCFGMQKQDPETPLWPKIASGAQNPFETPFETHPFQSPVAFYFRRAGGAVECKAVAMQLEFIYKARAEI